MSAASSASSTLFLTVGDPRGIGPEIVSVALEEIRCRSRVVVVGGHAMGKFNHLPRYRGPGEDDSAPVTFLPLSPGRKDLSFAFVEAAVDRLLAGEGRGLVTGPISKTAWEKGGVHWRGHTGYLAHRFQTEEHAMFFYSDDLKIALFTTHLALQEVTKRLTRERLSRFIRLVYRETRRLFGEEFHILVPGLNPHAGEDGLMGREEVEIIGPVVLELSQEMPIEGPFPADTLFHRAHTRSDAVIISLYHDQGLIPFKMMHFHTGVNLTLGLPVIRSSPDHGPAFDIAGTGEADPRSMIAALKLADRLVHN